MPSSCASLQRTLPGGRSDAPPRDWSCSRLRRRVRDSKPRCGRGRPTPFRRSPACLSPEPKPYDVRAPTSINSSVEPPLPELTTAISSPFGLHAKSLSVWFSAAFQISRESLPAAFCTTRRCSPSGAIARRFPSGRNHPRIGCRRGLRRPAPRIDRHGLHRRAVLYRGSQAGAAGHPPRQRRGPLVWGSRRVTPLAVSRKWIPSASEYAIHLPSGEIAAA